LNPEEQCNALVKRAMANALPGSVDHLHRLARREFGRLKRHPEMIVRFFRHESTVRYLGIDVGDALLIAEQVEI
jgi:hypothetical protein